MWGLSAPRGSAEIGGSMHFRWYTPGQVPHTSMSPPRPHFWARPVAGVSASPRRAPRRRPTHPARVFVLRALLAIRRIAAESLVEHPALQLLRRDEVLPEVAWQVSWRRAPPSTAAAASTAGRAGIALERTHSERRRIGGRERSCSPSRAESKQVPRVDLGRRCAAAPWAGCCCRRRGDSLNRSSKWWAGRFGGATTASSASMQHAASGRPRGRGRARARARRQLHSVGASLRSGGRTGIAWPQWSRAHDGATTPDLRQPQSPPALGHWLAAPSHPLRALILRAAARDAAARPIAPHHSPARIPSPFSTRCALLDSVPRGTSALAL